GWVAPTGIATFNDSGTYAPNFLVKAWKDDHGETNVFLVDGYAATAEAMQAASLSDVLDIDSTMSVLSPTFELAHDEEYALMRSAPDKDFGGKVKDPAVIAHYRESVATAELSNVPLRHRTLRVQDLMPEKNWRVLASLGYLCDDPYTGTHGVEKLDELRYRVTTRLYTHNASSKITFTFRLKDSLEDSRLIFSPLLVRFLDGEDYKNRPVKISDSGRIRNELQTLISQALQYDGDRIRVHFDRIDDKVLPRDKQKRIREILEWYRAEHPVWFSWLDF
ncbi:MAG TPA: hypothetical protein VGE37_08655, partial [Archangium sp.]